MFAGDIVMASVLLLMLVPGSDVAVVLLFVPLTVTLAQQRSWSAALLGSPVVHWLGLISYSLYLVHQPIDHYMRPRRAIAYDH
jgi:peptidoglycan/LPS O-acetylase OafA/YrhL